MNNLESVLTEELRPVTAPPELWERVEMPRLKPVRVAVPRWTWAMAAAAVLIFAAASGLRLRGEIRSNDAAEIRAWVRQNTGMDVPIERSPLVQLSGARIVRRGEVAEIRFKAAEFDATLVVSRASQAAVNASHRSVDGLAFAVNSTSPEGMQAACRLCHG